MAFSERFIQRIVNFRPNLTGYFFRRTRNLEDAEDLAQETAFAAFESGKKGKNDGDITNFNSWMFEIACGVLSAKHKRESVKKRGGGQKPVSLDSDTPTLNSGSFPPRQDVQIRVRELFELAATMPEKWQHVFHLHFVNGWTLQETALETGMTIGMVSGITDRIRKRIRRAEEKPGPRT